MKSMIMIALKLFFFTICVSSLYGIQGTSITLKTKFPQFCKQAVTNDDCFANFRNHTDCRGMVDTVNYEFGLEYLNWIIEEAPQFLSSDYLEKFRLNDALGQPITFDYGDYGIFSPTTLRYVKAGLEIQKMFGDLSQLNIVEIGGGYGGQCKIINELGGFASYTIIDLPEVNALARKYLTLQGVEKVHFIDCYDVNDIIKFDLVISNYAFSEVDSQQQLNYFETIIHHAPRGYMTLNFTSHIFDVTSLTEREVLDLLLLDENKNIKILPEVPLTNANNELLVWSE